MLPFLKNKQQSVAGLIIKSRTPDEKPEVDQDEQESDDSAAIESCVRALINAIHANDIKGGADALVDAFAIMEMRPHNEVEHDEPHSYDAQNQKAGKQD